MLKEYDFVEAIKDIDLNVVKGTKGAVLIVYDATPPAYEVEFVNDKNESLAVLTVKSNEIRKRI